MWVSTQETPIHITVTVYIRDYKDEYRESVTFSIKFPYDFYPEVQFTQLITLEDSESNQTWREDFVKDLSRHKISVL